MKRWKAHCALVRISIDKIVPASIGSDDLSQNMEHMWLSFGCNSLTLQRPAIALYRRYAQAFGTITIESTDPIPYILYQGRFVQRIEA